jgi:hypothetical protein
VNSVDTTPEPVYKKECPGVSLDLIRSVLKKLRSSKNVKCLGRGQNAEWEKAGKWK